MDIAFDSDSNPFITYTDSESNLGFVYKYTGGSWNLVGDGSYSEAIAVWGQLTIDSEGNPAVAYGSGDGWTLYTHVSKFDGSDWTLYGGGAIDPDNATYFNHQIKYDGDDNLTLLICSNAGPQQLDGYRWSGSEWASIGENISGGGTENISMQVNNEDNIVVAFTDLLNGNGVSVYTYNGSEWTPIGLTGFTPIAGGVSLAIDTDGIPFVSYTDANEGDKVSAKKYSEVVGIKTLDDVDEDLVIYPNPTKDFVNIRVPENQNGALVQIFDLSGKAIYTTTAVTSTVQINVSELSPGIYIVRVGNQQTRLVIR